MTTERKILAKKGMNISEEIDNILVGFCEYSDEEINEFIETNFSDDLVLSCLDVKGLYILLTNMKSDAEGIGYAEFDLEEI